MRYLLFICFLMISFTSFASSAWAACTSPAGAASQTRYDFTANKMYYCNNTDWVEMGGGVLPALTAARIWVGNAANAAAAVNLSGDATLSNAGALTIANNAVTTAKINNAAITLAKLAANSVDSSKIVDGAVAAADLASNAVTEVKIANSAVTNAKIANATIVATTKLSATGTKNNTTFLRGDNTWAVPPTGGGGLSQGAHCGIRTAKCTGRSSSVSYSGSNIPCGGTTLTASCSTAGTFSSFSCPSGFTHEVLRSEVETQDVYHTLVSTTSTFFCIKS